MSLTFIDGRTGPRRVLVAAALIAAALLAACSDKSQREGEAAAEADASVAERARRQVDDMQRRADAFADPETLPGAGLYRAHCAGCHEGQVAKAPQRVWLEMMPADAVLTALTSGIMKTEASQLTDAQRRHIVEFLAKQPLEAAIKPVEHRLCTAEAAAFDLTDRPQQTSWGHDTRRFVPAEIGGLTIGDLPRLSLKWAFGFANALRARSQPALAMGAVFVGSQDGTVYALDLASGCVRWTFRASAEVRTAIVLEPWPEGAPPAQPRLFFADQLARVYALNALTGEALWSSKVSDHPNATVTGTPAYHGGRLYVPISSLEVVSAADPAYECCTFRGAVVGVDAASGAVEWTSYSIPEEPSEFKVTPLGTRILGPSGAPFWNSPAVDPQRGVFYVGSGENYSSPADENSDAIFAFKLETGARVWRRQATARDAWNVACGMEDNPNCPEERGPDLDFAASPLLISLADGREIVVAGQKAGMVHGIDPDTGAFLWQTRVGRGGVQGGVHFGLAAEGTRVYVPITDMPIKTAGVAVTGEAFPGMHAVDAATGQILWRTLADDVCRGREFCDPGISAAATAIPGGVIAGHLDGRLRGYDGATGAVVWEVDTSGSFETVNGISAHGGSMSGPGPVAHRGHLVLNSGYGIYLHMPGNVLLVYGLAGN